MRVELIFFEDCPNVEGARAQLDRAFIEFGAPPQWQEWDGGDPASPAYASKYGSPTILVDGKDVAGCLPTEGADCCRLYRDAAGQLQGVPSVEVIAAALRSSGSQATPPADIKRSNRSRSWLAILPAVGLALLPKVACPACWPAYAGLLSSLGLPLLANTTYLLPLTALFLVLAVGALGFRAKSRWGHAPFVLGVLAASLMMVGKFVFDFDPALYGGIAILIAASVWNSWQRTKATETPCPACAPARASHEIGSTANEV